MDIVNKYFPNLNAQQQAQFGELGELYRFWNAQINVISRQDVENLYERHVLHSLGIAKVVNIKEFSSILDIGTGGGFPGIPLAILYPTSEFHLVDSIGKKMKVVQEVAQALKLTNVRAEKLRAEQADGLYDFAVTRAVAPSASLYEWVRAKISRNHVHELRNGILALKGGDLQEELQELRRKYRIFELSSCFDEAFFATKKVVHIPIG
ncbi:MAG: 16S rRNA (guanine(527)-N(7))-methyltransferase RsmG [Runella slithyformis]|nr:MAG: 16S rRNA (guanine(527)-N(7))-methyltransferase RsmG [Runella slithyformis]TAF92985.1 MAG: 16S rRNA (guanine(527)-N(7))-methyltransferase RsmG [Runella sp.]TAG24662.1 MAG: 16S rRNA (guanine(527)-N(7))-methyltransferase RsmG [Cytophagales bacterium]TAG42290.1 MAG: 16S rRNA (guanine(527)-N(7))-methyltransferase RsmG [Cytophagia bacterium]TAF23400.1 MAG: 16S rRNA (guanine(527)-N(7))-methyltransferase RsmG [Runella slithyformis]